MFLGVWEAYAYFLQNGNTLSRSEYLDIITFFFLTNLEKWIENKFGTEGAFKLCDLLKFNTTLTGLNIGGMWYKLIHI